MEDMREQEERQNAVVSRLQCDLACQYRQYREERDSRSLLLLKYSLCRCAAEPDEEAYDIPAYDEDKDPVKLKIALKVCRKDLSDTEGELNKIKSEYWGVVPRQDWDALEDAHKRTLLQLQELQRDFDQLKSEHDTLKEVHKREAVQPGVNPEDDLKNNDKEGDGGEEGDVLEPVRTPSSGDRQVYINQLRELLDGKGPVSVADMRAALTSLDPALESAALDHTLGLAFQVDATDLDQDALQLDTETLLQRLDVSPRTSPAPQQD
ncbi:translin-associated factor X-interacting protein 1 [Gadus chalcogrammus]|uniref:translin-associated factor X-interacting protein 1 n=1 Tax=Gadus chalcogrammus TaxID=1042646 RepID=UPI0024C49399|nr:translin-associated factor X-interacting protein 1 [Gadus chalcogrammus]